MINSATPASADESYHFGAATFTASANMLCTVTSSVQASTSAAVGAKGPFLRNAIKRNGVGENDGTYGLYFYSTGATYGPPQSRTSTISVAAGQTVQFGFYLGSTPTSYRNHYVDGIVSYQCS